LRRSNFSGTLKAEGDLAVLDLANLTFTARRIERLYLNKERTLDRFTTHLGAISEWASKATTEAGVAAGVMQFFNVQTKVGAGDDIKYDLRNPVAQALLLQSAVQAQNLLVAMDDATLNDYVLVDGKCCLRHPDAPPAPTHVSACAPSPALEAQRAEEERWLKFMRPGASDARAWLVVVQRDNTVPATAVADEKWLSPNGMSSYAGAHRHAVLFGALQARIGDFPLIAPISLFLD
jgi:hypothetical protein